MTAYLLLLPSVERGMSATLSEISRKISESGAWDKSVVTNISRTLSNAQDVCKAWHDREEATVNSRDNSGFPKVRH